MLTEQKNLHWTQNLAAVRGCQMAIDWGKDFSSPQAAWDGCQRGDHLLWWLDRLAGPAGSSDRRELVITACACASVALPYAGENDQLARNTLEIAERWGRGDPDVTLDQVRAAATAARTVGAAWATTAANNARLARTAWANHDPGAPGAAARAARAATVARAVWACWAAANCSRAACAISAASATSATTAAWAASRVWANALAQGTDPVSASKAANAASEAARVQTLAECARIIRTRSTDPFSLRPHTTPAPLDVIAPTESAPPPEAPETPEPPEPPEAADAADADPTGSFL